MEVLVFVSSVLMLKKVYPKFDAIRILRGICRVYWIEMALACFASWSIVLIYQSTHSGMDLSLNFSWMDCVDKENSTWIGGFEWEC